MGMKAVRQAANLTFSSSSSISSEEQPKQITDKVLIKQRQKELDAILRKQGHGKPGAWIEKMTPEEYRKMIKFKHDDYVHEDQYKGLNSDYFTQGKAPIGVRPYLYARSAPAKLPDLGTLGKYVEF